MPRLKHEESAFLRNLGATLDRLMDFSGGGSDEEGDTEISPVFQYGKSDVLYLDNCLHNIIEQSAKMNGEIVLTSAYINFGEPLEQSLLKIAEHGSKLKMILPNPQTNSFHNVLQKFVHW